MTAPSAPIVVVGPGAVGGLLAALLTRAGTEVVVTGRAAALAEIYRNGITVRSEKLGTWTSRPVTSAEIPQGSDVLLTVKAFGLAEVLGPLASARPAALLSLLNGIGHAEVLRQRLSGTRVIPGTITVETRRVSRSWIDHRSPFLSICVPVGERSNRIVDVLARAGVEVTTGEDEATALWRKFRFLVPMALLTAHHQSALGDAMDRDPGLTAEVVAEVAAAATAAGLPTTVAELTGILNGLPPSMRSSLQLDLAAGGASELEAVGGALLDFARSAGLSAPACAELVDSLRGS